MRFLGAFIRRDLRIARSYRTQLVSQLFGVVVALVSYSFLARIVPGDQQTLRPYGSDYFTFILIGTGVSAFFVTGIHGFSATLGQEQAAGTLEALLVTPNDPRTLLIGGAAWAFIFSALQLLVYMAGGIIFFGAHAQTQNLALVAVVLAMSLVAFATLGLLAAATIIQTKRGTFFVGATSAFFGIVGGVLYPIAVLPGWLQAIAHLLPITYGIDGVRRALLPSPDLLTIGGDVLALAAFTAVMLPAAVGLFGWSVDRARRAGSIAQY